MTGRPLAATLALAALLAGCGGGAEKSTSAEDEQPPPAEISGIAVASEHRLGARVAEQQGCLACHRIGEGGSTLGPDLTEVGARVPRAGIARSIKVGPGTMPSYAGLLEKRPAEFNALLGFLAALGRGR